MFHHVRLVILEAMCIGVFITRTAGGETRPRIKAFQFSGDLTDGMRAVVTCSVISGNPPFSFTWMKDNSEIKGNQDFMIRTIEDISSVLVITKLGPQSNGNYTCRVSNREGIDEHSDSLLMKGRKASLFSKITNPDI